MKVSFKSDYIAKGIKNTNKCASIRGFLVMTTEPKRENSAGESFSGIVLTLCDTGARQSPVVELTRVF